MRYLLYEAGAPSVALEKEICNLENYIDLEKLRFGDRLSLSFQKEGDILSATVPPLILLTFVENGFKHGVSHTTEEGKVTILLEVKPDLLVFEVTNPVEGLPAGDANGIGLKNVIRRLDLLYGDRYQLDLAATDHQFRATLKMPLS
jgi:LytS/YehU family sensor histidine kinase